MKKMFLSSVLCTQRKLNLLLILTLVMTSTSWAQIAINEANFPDEKFREWILSQSYGSDGVLTDEEINGITNISVDCPFKPNPNGGGSIIDRDKAMNSLKGIEYFTAITQLHCDYNNLTSLDISKNTELSILYCVGNQLTSLDISHCPKLGYLFCNSNQLTSLDVSKHTSLYMLDCGNNKLTSLDVSQNNKLIEFDCSKNRLTRLNVDNLASLELLDCNDNSLYSLNVSNNTKLEELICTNNQLSSLDVRQNTQLKTLECDGNQLATIDLSQNTALTTLNCNNNKFTSLDVHRLWELVELDCSDNNLTSLNVSQCQKLKRLRCGGNQLTSIGGEGTYLHNNPKLITLFCYSNQIKDEEMDKLINSLPNVSNVFRSGITRMFLVVDTKNTNEGNVCTKSQVIAANKKGWFVYDKVGGDYYSYQEYEGSGPGVVINATNFPDYHFRNMLSQNYYGADGVLTDEEIMRIKELNLNSCDISNLKGIEYFTELTTLYCHYNHLTSLDLSKNTKLTALGCMGNQLTSLDVSKNTELKWLNCSNNQIKGVEMDELVNSLPIVETKDGVFCVIDTEEENEGNVCTRAQVAKAKEKGWMAQDVNGHEYEGSGPINQQMDPVDENDDVDFGNDMDEDTDLNGNVIGNIFYNIGSANGRYSAEEGCIVVTKPMNDSQVESLETEDIFGETFKNGFTGIVFKVPEGKGKVLLTAETTGSMVLKVKIGNSEPVEMELEGKLKVTFPYNVSEETLVYIYGGQSVSHVNEIPAAEDAVLKIYGIEFERNNALADVNGDGAVDSADIVAVIKEMPDGDKKADVNNDGAIDSADIVAVIKAMK